MLISHIGAETPSIDAAKTVAKYLDLALTLYDFGLRTHVGNPSPAFIFNLLEVTHSMNDLRITLKQMIDKKKIPIVVDPWDLSMSYEDAFPIGRNHFMRFCWFPSCSWGFGTEQKRPSTAMYE